jgi:hypothetical protein
MYALHDASDRVHGSIVGITGIIQNAGGDYMYMGPILFPNIFRRSTLFFIYYCQNDIQHVEKPFHLVNVMVLRKSQRVIFEQCPKKSVNL